MGINWKGQPRLRSDVRVALSSSGGLWLEPSHGTAFWWVERFQKGGTTLFGLLPVFISVREIEY